jgi:hypothetical protein
MNVVNMRSDAKQSGVTIKQTYEHIVRVSVAKHRAERELSLVSYKPTFRLDQSRDQKAGPKESFSQRPTLLGQSPAKAQRAILLHGAKLPRHTWSKAPHRAQRAHI